MENLLDAGKSGKTSKIRDERTYHRLHLEGVRAAIV
jgi:hypothetical protein